MKDWSIKRKLWTLSFVSFFTLIMTSAVSYYYIRSLSKVLKEEGSHQLINIKYTNLADMNHDAINGDVIEALFYINEHELFKKNEQEFQDDSKKLLSNLDTLIKENENDTNIIKELKETQSKANEYILNGKNVLELSQEKRTKEATDFLRKFKTNFESLAHSLEKIDNEIEKASQESIQNGVKISSDANNFETFLIVFGFIVLFGFSLYINQDLITTLSNIIAKLKSESGIVTQNSEQIATISEKLSGATTEQAASLQQTVASVDQISAMISRNADSATSSSKSSEQTMFSAQKGKEKAELMLDSINAISHGNDEIIGQIQKSNKEITEIVSVIQEISEKTQVINDIVFQTKLLSFNASVEAARAGQHGKGFAVVAEEVGNLASMSGKAANEITEMLSRSVKNVTDIVERTKTMMDNLIKKSKEKVETGAMTAKDCTRALDEILVNVSAVNGMVKEISTASREQSQGVREINKAMSELDQVTQTNSTLAEESSQTARGLNEQASRLVGLIQSLNNIIEGNHHSANRKQRNNDHHDDHGSSKNPDNLIPLKKRDSSPRKVAAESKGRKVVGLEFSVPSKNDSRFEDV